MRERHLTIPSGQLLARVSLHLDAGRHLDVVERPEHEQVHAEHHDSLTFRPRIGGDVRSEETAVHGRRVVLAEVVLTLTASVTLSTTPGAR